MDPIKVNGWMDGNGDSPFPEPLPFVLCDCGVLDKGVENRKVRPESFLLGDAKLIKMNQRNFFPSHSLLPGNCGDINESKMLTLFTHLPSSYTGRRLCSPCPHLSLFTRLMCSILTQRPNYPGGLRQGLAWFDDALWPTSCAVTNLQCLTPLMGATDKF